MNEPPLRKYPLTVRLLHWLHTIAFIILAITGIMLAAGGTGQTSLASFHTSLGHFWVALPVIFLIIRPRAAFRGVRLLCRWGCDDVAWLRAAPRYYLRGDHSTMPPQGFLNTGQKLWWLVTFVTWALLAVSGLIKEIVAKSGTPPILHTMTALHNAAFGVAGVVFLVHLYLALFHRQSLVAMLTGNMDAAYARENHAEWYAETTGKPDRPAGG
jgi:formate dehydrogenase subunit gamma